MPFSDAVGSMTISTILFDLDNTLYPASSGLMKGVDTRITEYVQNLLGLDLEAAQTLRKQYFTQYGTTLRGLECHHAVDPEDYLAYVHDLAIETFLASDGVRWCNAGKRKRRRSDELRRKDSNPHFRDQNPASCH